MSQRSKELASALVRTQARLRGCERALERFVAEGRVRPTSRASPLSIQSSSPRSTRRRTTSLSSSARCAPRPSAPSIGSPSRWGRDRCQNQTATFGAVKNTRITASRIPPCALSEDQDSDSTSWPQSLAWTKKRFGPQGRRKGGLCRNVWKQICVTIYRRS
jgi:hypothetical protein